METNASEPLINCRKCMDVIKTGKVMLTLDESGGTIFLAECTTPARKACLPFQTVTGMEAASTRHRLQTGTWEPATGWKGRNPSGGNARTRIPMPDAGTEQSVVVVKHRNWCGAKGLCQTVLFYGQPKGRSQ
jgi:hypothetical protein